METEDFLDLLGRRFECSCGRVHEVGLRKILSGRGVIEGLGELLEELGLGDKVCIVFDRITREVLGVRIAETLSSSGFRVGEIVVEGAYMGDVERVEEALGDCGAAVAVGGGSVIDVCKLASYRRQTPFISVPTTLSQDAMASGNASIIGGNGLKRTYRAWPPLAVVFELEVLERQPRRFISAGVADMMAKATCLKDWELGRDEKSEYYCPLAAELSHSTFHEVVRFVEEDMNNLETLALSLLKSGLAMTIAGSSRPSSGAEHLFAHYIDRHTHGRILHGEQVGIGTLALAYYHKLHNPRWWREEVYQWRSLRRILEKADAPTKLEDIGVGEELAVAALCHAPEVRPERYTILHKRPISPGEARVVLREVGLLS